MSKPPALPPTTLRGIKRKAKTLSRELNIPHSEALEMASRLSGYQNLQHARRALKTHPDVMPASPKITPEQNTPADNTRAEGARMGIKMNTANDQNGAEWCADTYQKGMGAEPLECSHCGTAVTFNMPHTREMYDKPVLVPGYFRLLPKGAHAANCPFGVDDEVNKLAKSSEGLIESIQQDKYRMRLVMIKEALEGGTPKKPEPDGTRAQTGRTYTSNPGLLPAYINSASRALKLRAMCESNRDIEQHLELIFEGNVKVSWDQFYFDPARHMEAYHAISQNITQHPIALEGQVKSIRTEIKGDAAKNVMNLQMNPFRMDANDANNGIGLEVSIWSPQASWFRGINPGDKVVVLGMWKINPGSALPAPIQGGRFMTLTKRRLNLNLILKAQITKVESALA
ncbi:MULTISPECIES: hypothetical protein [Pseudomonas]|nr:MULTISPECIES: hypothetical protein [Pseudomonas]MCE0780159.1 hypothetical protein [Pseudomonas sp. NMI542_15]MDT3750274.1 hypothetical protein [Pseudomonas kurunegalensis]QNL87576.1 Uncharacterized protein PPKH_2162 [Pseudomonas putida]